MEEVYSAADLVVARAGAASLAEFAAFSLPGILIPFPYAADDHQTRNAEIYAYADAAILLKQSDLLVNRWRATSASQWKTRNGYSKWRRIVRVSRRTMQLVAWRTRLKSTRLIKLTPEATATRADSPRKKFRA